MRNCFLKLGICILCICSLLALYSCDSGEHSHLLTYHEANEATCETDGNIEYWSCSGCDKIFSDEAANNEIDNVIVPASHSLVHNELVAATCTENGKAEHWFCSKCNVRFSDSSATAVAHNLFLAGGHNFVDGVCSNCEAVGTPELIYSMQGEMYAVVGVERSDLLRIVIPSTYEGKAVAYIADGAFKDCTSVRSIEIGSSVIAVGEDAFAGCDKLVEIVNKSEVSIPYQQVSQAEIHPGATKFKNINGYLFYVRRETESILIGYVGDETELVLLEKFVIDDSIRVLLPRMVIAADFEKTFLIPLLDKFEDTIEKHCKSLSPDTNFSFFDNENYVAYEYGCINTSQARQYLRDMQTIHRSLYKSVTDESKEFNAICNDINKLVANYALRNPNKYDESSAVLENMYREYPITRSGIAVYSLNSNMSVGTKEELSAGIIKKYFSDYTYQIMYEQERACGCVFDEYAISKTAFSGNDKLTGIMVSKGVSSVSGDAFDGCTRLINITVSEEHRGYSSINGNLYSKDGKKLIRYAPGKNETSFTVPASVELVERYAFKDHSLKKIIIAEGVTEIKANAFSQIYSPEDQAVEIILPESLEKIGNRAFEYIGLEKIHIPAGVTSVGIGAFSGGSLNSITVDEKNTVYHVTNNCLIHTSKKMLVLGTANSVIPNDGSVEIIASEAFACISELESIHIPSSVLFIMNGAFISSCNFEGFTYDGDAFFFSLPMTSIVDGVPTTTLLFDEYYDIEKESHRVRLIAGTSDSSLYRSQDTVEYYYEFYRNYIESLITVTN